MRVCCPCRPDKSDDFVVSRESCDHFVIIVMPAGAGFVLEGATNRNPREVERSPFHTTREHSRIRDAASSLTNPHSVRIAQWAVTARCHCLLSIRVSLVNPRAVEEPGTELQLHRRTYDVNVFMIDDRTMRIRGEVRADIKPAHLHFPNDADELTIHHMIVDLIVDVASMEITDVDVVFDSFPQTTCPNIADHYHELIGSSIGRGFTARIRELFGGPRGCTHTNVLLLAMAPVFIQALWSLKVVNQRNSPVDVGLTTVLDRRIRFAGSPRLGCQYRHLSRVDGRRRASRRAPSKSESNPCAAIVRRTS